MNQRIAVIGLAGVCALVLGAGLYLSADADSPDDGLPEPRVEGRLVTLMHSDGIDFSATIICEYDAHVTIADGNVSAVESAGTNTRVEPGEMVVEDWGSGPPVMVHRGQDGLLHIGCAPESQRVD